MKLVMMTAFVAACLPPAGGGGGSNPAWIADTSSYGSAPAPATRASTVASYRDVAAKIIETARKDRTAYARLAELTDGIGARLSGSPELTRAIAWAVSTLKADGHEVRTEKVMVPHWVRGAEEASLSAPIARRLSILGLGGTIATPKGGITAPVVVVKSFDDLDARAADIKGKIVLFDVPMPAFSDDKGSGYGDVAPYRGIGASRAAKHGAVAALVRSVTAHSLRTPHTGSMFYLPDMPRIPAAAVTVEDAPLISRLAAKGPVSIKLRLDNQHLPDAESANVIAELRGREKPDEIVLIGAHLDSWDVGQGAHDDGAGCVMVMQALSVLKQLGLQPRRTIRVVLFTNEENGLRGARAYVEAHKAELDKHVLAFESDIGGYAPRGFGIEASKDALPRVIARTREIGTLMAPLGVTRIAEGHAGSDVGGLVEAGVPGLGLLTDHKTYFDIHHTDADTLDKVDPAALADNVAAVAILAYVVADMPGRLDDK